MMSLYLVVHVRIGGVVNGLHIGSVIEVIAPVFPAFRHATRARKGSQIVISIRLFYLFVSSTAMLVCVSFLLASFS